MFQPRSLQQRLSIFLLLPLALLLITVGFAGFIYARNLLISQWQEASILKLQRAAHQVDMRLQQVKDWIRIFNQATDGRDEPMLHLLAIQQLESLESVNHVHLTWGNKPAHDAKLQNNRMFYGYSRTRLHKQGMRGQNRIMKKFHSARIKEITPPRYDDAINHETVSLISDLNDEQGVQVGRLEVVLDFAVLIENILESGWWQGNKAFLVDNTGEILTGTLQDKRGFLSNSEDSLEFKTLKALNSEPYGTILGKGHPPVEVSGFYRLQEAPWSLLMFAPGKEILSPIVRFRFYYLALGTGFVFSIVILIKLITAPTVRVIRDVSKAAQRVAAGEYKNELPVETKDEVGELTRSFNSMALQLKERSQMKAAMDLAMEVQQNLLPQAMPEVNGLDIAAQSLYCDETGGDFYDFLKIGSGNSHQIGITVGDVSGHGISSALLMASVRAFLKSRVTHPGSVAEIITDVNRLLTGDIGDSGQFLTLFYATVDAEDKALRWVRAGHDPAIYYDPVADSFEELKGEGMAIGLESSFEYRENLLAGLAKGQILLIGTDGLWETQNVRGEMFGKDRLKAIIRRESLTSSEEILHNIGTALKEFRGERKQEDDITLLVMKIID